MKNIFWIITVLVLAVGMQSVNAAKLYKWVDEYGNVTYRDTPPTDASGEVEEKYISGGTETNATSEAVDAAAQSAPVVLYSTPSCATCGSIRAYFRSRGVPFQDKNVMGDREMQKELKKVSGELSVPTILIGEKVMRGYVQSILEDELTAAGYPKPGQDDFEPQAGETIGGEQAAEQ